MKREFTESCRPVCNHNPVYFSDQAVTFLIFLCIFQLLFLVTRGRKLPIAGFLSPPERESFAKALAAAIGEAKRGPTRTVL